MREKRFTTVSIGMEEVYCDFSIIKVGDKIISDGIPTTDAIGICDLLNELNDENDILKQQLQTRYIVNKQYEELQRLKKENEQLNELNEENQELKRLIKKMGELGGFNKHLIKTICGELNDE